MLAILAEGDSYGYAIIKRVGDCPAAIEAERRRWQVVDETLHRIWVKSCPV